MTVPAVNLSRSDTVSPNSFIIFVDGMFTTSIEVAFTNDFDVLAANQAIA
jgi:hypothetical protein